MVTDNNLYCCRRQLLFRLITFPGSFLNKCHVRQPYTKRSYDELCNYYLINYSTGQHCILSNQKLLVRFPILQCFIFFYPTNGKSRFCKKSGMKWVFFSKNVHLLVAQFVFLKFISPYNFSSHVLHRIKHRVKQGFINVLCTFHHSRSATLVCYSNQQQQQKIVIVYPITSESLFMTL